MSARQAIRRAAGAAAGAFFLAAAAQAGAQPTALKLDQETQVNGVPVACTGIGQTKDDPHWLSYPVRVEFSNARNEYFTDVEITVSDRAGHTVVQIGCEGPWILLKLAPGNYRIDGRLLDTPAKPRSAPFSPPAHGQMRLVLQFPDA